MAMQMKMQMKMSQQLIMTPQLQQAIKLLQLSRTELEELIDDTFSEFVEEPIPETAGGAVDLVNDIFIASGDISLHDVHAAYLESHYYFH